MRHPYRVVVGTPGPDNDGDGEATLLARALRDGGFEVIYAGPHHPLPGTPITRRAAHPQD